MAKKVNGLRWWIIGLIFLATVINYIDRSALGIMWGGEDVDGSIAQSLSLTKEHYAWIANVFMVAYAIGQLLSGKVFDKIGTRAGYVISIVVWGASTAFHAVARGALSFGFFRATLGISEAGNWPGAVKKQCGMVPNKRKGYCARTIQCGSIRWLSYSAINNRSTICRFWMEGYVHCSRLYCDALGNSLANY
jgi:ACS family hexuronate transporter-like MFS transporter